MNLKQQEANKIARRINRLNNLFYKVIGETEDLINDPVVRELINQGYDHQDSLRKVAVALDKIGDYDEAINVSLYTAYFQDFDNLIGNIEEAKGIKY